MTRREVLAGMAGMAGVAGLTRSAAGMDPDLDAIVIGAGAAGLAAGADLKAAGLRIAVIEARDRIGGRVWTTEVAGRPFDAGAAYVHFRERNPWVEIARGLGVPLEEHRGWGLGRAYVGSRPIDEDGRAARAAGRRRLWQLMEGFDRTTGDTSLGALAAGEGEFTRLAATRYGQQAIGEEPEAISLLDLLTQWDGDDYTVPTGYGRLVALSGGRIPVELSTPATVIRWDGPGVQVETPRGVLKAARAIVTVPVGVLAAERVRFVPDLPVTTRAAIADLRPGALTKVALALDGERFGLPSPTDLYETKSGLVFELFPFDRDLVIATIGGVPARDLVALGEAGAVAAATGVLAGILGGSVRRHVSAGRLADWWGDTFALGSYSVARPGRLAARAELAHPVGERLWFAGEATAGGGSMTAGGATLAGRAAAAAVIAASGHASTAR